ncbi:hypothetical protein NEOLEDRAFT_260447 [Neolentinus lepideus HHB14362 ss-1]|uniref:F-box domain-containing protein n=1 Tax=Neolentinus lepideus HHB14362 ss-1 TaxID=1314782 RepID=A0A165T1S6_9AGAM|nr:hypothetical protein NEOLEDRAFT_260447 [Neolentinus lepideus HHB14362 ss-1]
MESSAKKSFICLLPPEILLYVFEIMYRERWNWPRGRSSVVACASTCKAFYGPVVDLLWRTLPNLDPLFRCMPWHLCKFNKGCITLERLPISSDWIRFCHYASRAVTSAESNISCCGLREASITKAYYIRARCPLSAHASF